MIGRNGKKPWFARSGLALLLILGAQVKAEDELNLLPVYGDKLSLESTYTVSGLSSGGYMAVQHHYAKSNEVTGAGIIAAGPYYCGENDLGTALTHCFNKPRTIGLDKLTGYKNQQRKSELIADAAAMKMDRVWLFHGKLDNKVDESVSDALHEQYKQEVKSIQYVNDVKANHHFPTLQQGTACDVSESPFVGACDYPAAQRMMNYITGINGQLGEYKEDRVFAIESELEDVDDWSLESRAILYVPESCEGDVCQLHVHYHGCQQGFEKVGLDYIRKNGVADWAEANSTVVLYPQIQSSMALPMNPQGCWDWWGYTGDDYANEKAKQIQFVESLIQQIQ